MLPSPLVVRSILLYLLGDTKETTLEALIRGAMSDNAQGGPSNGFHGLGSPFKGAHLHSRAPKTTRKCRHASFIKLYLRLFTICLIDNIEFMRSQDYSAGSVFCDPNGSRRTMFLVYPEPARL